MQPSKIYKLRHPSLELNWLPNSLLKGLPVPPIFVVEEGDLNYGGLYYHADGDSYICEGTVSLRHGAIFIVNTQQVVSALAHEFRHHWQQFNTGLPDDVLDWSKHAEDKSYKDAIIEYFQTQPHEYDALMFETKYTPNDVNLLWREWVTSPKS